MKLITLTIIVFAIIANFTSCDTYGGPKVTVSAGYKGITGSFQINDAPNRREYK